MELVIGDLARQAHTVHSAHLFLFPAQMELIRIKKELLM